MDYDVVILGAGAAGLMCAAQCGGRVLLVDHAKKPGEKIRISGGGRCNFTNTDTTAANYLSANPHFAKSALARYTPWDFVSLVSEHGIAWHEKTLGQLFCDGSAQQIVDMLTGLVARAGADLRLQTSASGVERVAGGFALSLTRGDRTQRISTRALVLATGGKSIPKMGASGFAYEIARQFDLPMVETRPALVPLTFPPERFAGLPGTALPTRVTADTTGFDEAMLFTHRGLSGPAILQASSYWHEGEAISVNLTPGTDAFAALRRLRGEVGRRSLHRALDTLIPAKLSDHLAGEWQLAGNLGDQSDKALAELAARLGNWTLTPAGSEGYRTAEVTLGGISTDALSSKDMQVKDVPGLYAIGECVDVTGWLGGYNFQWAWASAMAAARALSAGR
ncbi:NAD(P)/FAD-dependent oxidoreductase [Pseudooceanicola sediminis]|uniref:NAD(P)/FAD-dependent oxidoreductase n=1 Tax=Pseudooceanicola sediminis TaxID=2211117 RepID=A0A399J1K4_9RHOB|nr:NAD(P)/FAD-dependent oxidoreductase [Pseudooceanicola sediminis]KAA2316374.1 NAD(P)/FAD-dependent oxidoreductase [Puniceibacterium sp. HSS470]RII39150.1 NAD(P)/FAD-dependent oxidoreductase [Pseudooceanicola sediminis]|tara:strand:- start:10498 stop:11679 length:1182 start_codon:yes stop_codon:yes gene_type:complete